MIEDSLPASIYHYTDAAGLKGIIENGQFWASAVLSLNDRAEYFHGKKRAGSYLLEEETIAKFPKADPERVGSKIDEAELMDGIFVISFTTLADDLGQWRGYGAAGGFAIEFDTSELKRYLCSDPRVSSRLGKVIYDDRGDSLITELDRVMSERETAGTNVEPTEILLAAVMNKRSGWAAEKEVRWVALNHMHSPLFRDSGVRFRPGRYGLTLYMEIPFEPRPYLRNIIKSVTVGPGPFQEESARTLEVIGGAYIEGVASFTTHKSKIDLR